MTITESARDLASPPAGSGLDDVVRGVLGPGRYRHVDLCDLLHGGRSWPESADVVQARDDALPRLAHDGMLHRALSAGRRALRPGGVLVAEAPELGGLRGLRAATPPPRVVGSGPDRTVLVQLWDWSADGGSYRLEVLALRCVHGRWDVVNAVTTNHRVLSAGEVAAALTDAGLLRIRRLDPAETGHALPIWVGMAER